MNNSNEPINPTYKPNKDIDFIGLSKREYFAGLAMQGLLNNYAQNLQYGNHVDYPMVSEIAVRCADDLLNELEKAK